VKQRAALPATSFVFQVQLNRTQGSETASNLYFSTGSGNARLSERWRCPWSSSTLVSVDRLVCRMQTWPHSLTQNAMHTWRLQSEVRCILKS